MSSTSEGVFVFLDDEPGFEGPYGSLEDASSRNMDMSGEFGEMIDQREIRMGWSISGSDSGPTMWRFHPIVRARRLDRTRISTDVCLDRAEQQNSTQQRYGLDSEWHHAYWGRFTLGYGVEILTLTNCIHASTRCLAQHSQRLAR